MDYVILNGKKSTLIKGLLIQSLPIISKPPMRTSIEEIDGRDGDIVTKLGYAAYDRAMKIGLFGDFDIYEVINFFNSEGEAIFSNEMDKVYEYKVLQQIDFDKLLRFREATVVFHCQPYKYSSTDTMIEWGLSETEITVFNGGNTYATPIIHLYNYNGFAQTKAIVIDGVTVATIKRPDDETVTKLWMEIDVAKMKATAYKTAGKPSMDRYLSCDYHDLYLSQGEHVIGCGYGHDILRYERWI